MNLLRLGMEIFLRSSRTPMHFVYVLFFSSSLFFSVALPDLKTSSNRLCNLLCILSVGRFVVSPICNRLFLDPTVTINKWVWAYQRWTRINFWFTYNSVGVQRCPSNFFGIFHYQRSREYINVIKHLFFYFWYGIQLHVVTWKIEGKIMNSIKPTKCFQRIVNTKSWPWLAQAIHFVSLKSVPSRPIK